MKPEHQKIIDLITEYLEQAPELRFTQALFNLNISQFDPRFTPTNENSKDYPAHRDNYNDLDKAVIERILNSNQI